MWTLFIIALATAGLIIHAANASDFFVAGGSSSADIIIRISAAKRLVVLCLLLGALALALFRPSAVALLLVALSIPIFALGQHTLVMSGKDFTVGQKLMLVPYRTFNLVENELQSNQSQSFAESWCCLTTGSSPETRSLFLGLGPLKLPADAVSDAIGNSGLK